GLSESEISVYPNPATDLITVEWQPADFILPNMEQSIDNLIRMSEQQDIPSLQVTMPSVSSIERIELYDRSGRLVMSQRVNQGEYYKQLQVGHLNPGLFILIQVDSNGQVIAKEKISVIRR
ncbi:MAG: T9SS type A sorting domain-containing protein, partial [Bacteroidota bacterium]